MKNLLLLLGVSFILLVQTTVQAQNIFSGEPVQVVGSFNGYVTTPYNSDYRTSSYRRVSVNTGNPTDGRGQWATTMNAQSSGGDFVPVSMPGGGGNGFLFISGPSSSRFQNKWVFSGTGQGALNAINGISAYNSGNDMGLDMSTAGRYTFVFNDCGYTQTNAKYYVGYTAAAPVTVSNGSVSFSAGQPVISISTGSTPSSGENVYVRFRAGTNDFTSSTSVVQASGSGTSWTATLPQQSCGSTVYYYVYTSTRTLSQISGDNETDRTLAVLRYDDNGGNNYSFNVSPVPTAAINNNSGTTVLTCSQTAISVTATGGVSYSWDNGLGSGASKSITSPGTYTVTVSGDNGCTSTAQIVITQDITAPTAGITNNSGTTIITCSNSISVTATGGVSYAWDNGLGNSANATIATAGTFTVTVTGVNGCTSTASITTTVNGTNTWNGSNGNFSDGSKWSCGVPSSGDLIAINAGDVTLDVNFTVQGSLTLSNTATLTVNPSVTLSVGPAGTLALGGKSVTFKSDASGTASLGQVNGTLTGATNVTVERYIPNNGFRSWRLLSVPTFGNGQTVRQAWQEGVANPSALQNNLPGFGTQITGPGNNAAASQAQGFDNAGTTSALLSWSGSGWTAASTTNQAIAGQKAWFLYIRGERSKGVTGLTSDASATTLRTNGTVYTGDQVNTLGANATALIGNVYPSAIDFTGLVRTGGVTNTFYIWDSKKLNGISLGAYQTFSGTNGYLCLLSGGSYTVGQPNTIIESGQGFLVKSTTAGTLTLKESAKVSGSNGLGLRPSAPKAKIDSRLFNDGGDMLDANAVVFDAAYDRTVNSDDANKLGNPGTNFAVERENNLLAIEATQPPVNNDVIPFRMWNLQQQTYKLEFAASNMNTEGLSAVLEDNYLHSATAIDLTTTTTVNFTVDGNSASADANRFRFVFSKSKPAVADTRKGYSIAPNPVENGLINLQFRNQAAGKYSVRILNHNGQAMQLTSLNHTGGTASQQVSLPAGVAAGTYRVVITAPDKTTTVQTVLVNRK